MSALTIVPSSDFSLIHSFIDQLQAIPKERYTTCVTKVKQLATALSTFSTAHASLNGRIQFIGTYLLHELSSLGKVHDISVLESLLCETTNLKNALQIEAVFYGAISKMFDRHLLISQIPELKELWAEMPFMFRNISHDEKLSCCLRINLKPLNAYFEKLDLDTIPETFDTTMIQIFQNYPVMGDELIIPFELLPPIEIINTYMQSSDFHSKLIAQIFLFCKIEEENIQREHISKLLSQNLLLAIKAHPFDYYLPKKGLIPLLCHFVEASEALKAKAGDPLDLLFDETFLHEDHTLKDSDWLEDASVCFELIRKIELSVRRIFKIGMLSYLDERMLTEGCDKKVIKWTKCFSDLKDRLSFPIDYPIDNTHPFVLDKTAFKRLCLPFYINENLLSIEKERLALDRKALKKALGAKKKEFKVKAIPVHMPLALEDEKKPSSVLATEAASAGAGIMPPLEEPDDELDLEAFFPGKKKPVASSLAAKASLSTLRPRASSFEASLKRAFEHLSTLTFHKRIKVWQRSMEEGLAYYHFGEEGVHHDLSKEEMILRHRLPKDLLLLSLDPHFGVKKPLTLESGEIIDNHFESCLSIDGRKYILETSINSKGVVFHFYARRVHHIQDYKQMLSYSPLEFATIQTLAKGSTALDDEGKEFEGIDVARITFDKDGNALCHFEGHSYHMPIIKPFK
jgi:hypothetical protein